MPKEDYPAKKRDGEVLAAADVGIKAYRKKRALLLAAAENRAKRTTKSKQAKNRFGIEPVGIKERISEVVVAIPNHKATGDAKKKIKESEDFKTYAKQRPNGIKSAKKALKKKLRGDDEAVLRALTKGG